MNVETNHKPLESIYHKPLQSTLQRMLLRLQKYDINIVYKQGKHMYLADTLSRAYMQGTQGRDNKNSDFVHMQTELERELECSDVVQHIPVTDQRLQEIKQTAANDSTKQQLITTIVTGWPESRHKVTSYERRQHYNIREDLVV